MARSLSIRIGAPPATRTALHGGGPSRGRTLSQTRARRQGRMLCGLLPAWSVTRDGGAGRRGRRLGRSEEHTSELQSRLHLVCRLLLEKKKTTEAKERGC